MLRLWGELLNFKPSAHLQWGIIRPGSLGNCNIQMRQNINVEICFAILINVGVFPPIFFPFFIFQEGHLCIPSLGVIISKKAVV